MGAIICALGLDTDGVFGCDDDDDNNFVNFNTSDPTSYDKTCHKNCIADTIADFDGLEGCKSLCHRNNSEEDPFYKCIRLHYTNSNQTCEEADCYNKCENEDIDENEDPDMNGDADGDSDIGTSTRNGTGGGASEKALNNALLATKKNPLWRIPGDGDRPRKRRGDRSICLAVNWANEDTCKIGANAKYLIEEDSHGCRLPVCDAYWERRPQDNN